MNCERVQRALDALVDNELKAWAEWRVRRHLKRCAGCRAAHESTRRLTGEARAWRDVTAPAGLKARTAAALAAARESVPVTEDLAVDAIRMKERGWMSTARWAGAISVGALAVVLWLGGRRGGDVVDAAIRATEAAPAIHLIAKGDHGSKGERWIVAGVGSYLRQAVGGQELIEVDDLKHTYRYLESAHQVTITATKLGDPAGAAEAGAMYTLTGALRELQGAHKPEAIQVESVVKDGRPLRRVTALGDPEMIYLDPKTDRVVLIETRGRSFGNQIEQFRVTIDYPDPATVNRSLFRFTPPPGVTVVDRSGPNAHAGSQGPPTDPSGQCSWHLLQLREALLGYVIDHHGQWPHALRPDLDLYVKDNADFYCPADAAAKGKATSYVYYRPAAPVDPRELEYRWKVGTNLHQPDLPDRSGLVIECRFHSGEKRGLYLDGAVLSTITPKGR